MDYENIAPWEHYPKHLRFNEIQNPLYVISDFYSTGWPKDHKKKLKTWRYYVTHEGYYKGKDGHGPGTLLFEYDMNLRFIEAMHLLLIDYKRHSYDYKIATPEQLKEEQKKWAYFPKNLSDDELANPFIAIKKSFKVLKPQHYRDQLHEWLHSSLYNIPSDDVLNAGDIIVVYESLLKLYAAGWLIHQRETKEVYLEKSLLSQAKLGTLDRESIDEEIQLQQIHPELTEAQEKQLEEIRDLIIKRIPSVRMIVALGTSNDPFNYYLAILINDNERTPEHEVGNKIEDHCRFLANVFTFVSKESSARNAVLAGKRFWNIVMLKGIKIYQGKNVKIPEPQDISKDTWLERANHDWHRWGRQGKEFMKGATYYIAEGSDTLALFMLHQVVENSLMAIIKLFLGYRPSAHNLRRMLTITLLLTPKLAEIFDLESKEGSQLFSILQTGYSDARYKNDFQIDGTMLPLLQQKAESTLITTENIYKQFITGITNQETKVDTPLEGN